MPKRIWKPIVEQTIAPKRFVKVLKPTNELIIRKIDMTKCCPVIVSTIPTVRAIARAVRSKREVFVTKEQVTQMLFK